MAGVKKRKRQINYSFKQRANLALRIGMVNRQGVKWADSGRWTLDMAPVTNEELLLTVYSRDDYMLMEEEEETVEPKHSDAKL